jgi:hypothetical protein
MRNESPAPELRMGAVSACRVAAEAGPQDCSTEGLAVLPLTPSELEADSIGSYEVAISAIGERVKAGAPIPASMRSRKEVP